MYIGYVNHLWSDGQVFLFRSGDNRKKRFPKCSEQTLDKKSPWVILNCYWNYCNSSMKQMPLACLRCPHPFGLWWPPMAPIPGAVGRAFACVGPWLPVACGETEAITAGPWLACPRAPPPISHHGFSDTSKALVQQPLSWRFPVFIPFSPHPKGWYATCSFFFSSSVLPTLLSGKSRWIPMTG